MSLILRFAAATSLLLASTALAGAAATLSISPSSGPPATTTKVTLAGFSAGKIVDVYFDTKAKCLVLPDATGAGSCTFKVPADAKPASHWISAVVRSTTSGVQKSFLVRTDWPNAHGYNERQDGFARYENVLNRDNVGYLAPLWGTTNTIGANNNTPVIYRGRLFVASQDGKLHARDATTGAVISGWPKLLGGIIGQSSPVVANGIVYQMNQLSGGSAGYLNAYDVYNGAIPSGFPVFVDGVVRGAPIVVNGAVYVATSAGKIYGFDAAHGSTLFGYPIVVAGTPMLRGTPTYYNGRIHVGADDGHLYIYDVTSRLKVGDLTTTGAFDTSSAAVSGGMLYYHSYYEHKLRAYDLDTLADGWAAPYTMSAGASGTPAVSGDKVFIATSNGIIHAVDAATGEKAWTRLFSGHSFFGSPIVANGVLYIASTRQIFALDASWGGLLWRSGGNFYMNQGLIVANGRVYAPTRAGRVTAFELDGPVERAAAAVAKPSLGSLKPPTVTADE